MRYRGYQFVSCNLDVVTYYSSYQNENKFVIPGNAQEFDNYETDDNCTIRVGNYLIE